MGPSLGSFPEAVGFCQNIHSFLPECQSVYFTVDY